MSTTDSVFHYVYGLPPPTTSKRKEPMQILAVGISRSATESLREALHILGFNHTFHGFDTILPPSSLEAIYELLQKKYNKAPKHGETNKLTAEDFDTVLSDCVGVSDLLAAEFAPELISAYPKAKVILNTRHDLDSWYKSMEQTMGYFDKNPKDWDWLKSWFNADLFWIRQTMCRTMMPRFFRGSFAANGKWVYQQHVAMVRGIGLPPDRLLEWSVEDGWGPLCEFLNKDVPQEEFPVGNPPKAWAERIAVTMQGHHERALRNMGIFGAVLVVTALVLGMFILK
ncbi:hypothetical protein PENANT_c026G05592 [Penicillium antarcticum]|uniref:NAD dependent epimerase/dehydratase n=1 Tax=Penicillium antarcticum TaxID=416450 RepID=A0A1V6PX55_9EURO|nr:uncharacterized protein N7508_000092 [Penicillium antarcticum]KAJ5319809.1 hypothetical protein N7508_000092 [Penicillium antarcticum]OQD81571.1 hypothetical protein PENANT_c026G05592 [Penicillium antarcticum]